MDPITFREFKKRAIHSVKVHKMLCDGSFWENKCSIEKSIFNFGINSARKMVMAITIERIILG